MILRLAPEGRAWRRDRPGRGESGGHLKRAAVHADGETAEQEGFALRRGRSGRGRGRCHELRPMIGQRLARAPRMMPEWRAAVNHRNEPSAARTAAPLDIARWGR